MTIVKPRAIDRNSTIAVWAPSSPAPVLFPRRFQRALAALRAHGYTVVVGESCTRHVGYAALPPRALADEFHAMVADPAVDAVFCAVGGWTMLPVLQHIDWALVRDQRKLVVGFSDVSVFLWSQFARAGLTSIHGPTVVSDWGEVDGIAPLTLREFEAVSSGEAGRELHPPQATTDEMLWWDRDDVRPRTMTPAKPWTTIAEGTAEGPLLPGCLTSVAGLFGTPNMPDVTGAILCLEALDIAPDQLWARLSQWRLSGHLQKVSALVFGRIARLRPAATGFADAHWALREVAGDLGIPVLAGVDFGHTDPRLSLPVGTQARVDATRRSLVLLEPAVEAGGAQP